ncbi:MAG: Ig-like domain-containing protein, partial [Planctomycetota bacterium]
MRRAQERSGWLLGRKGGRWQGADSSRRRRRATRDQVQATKLRHEILEQRRLLAADVLDLPVPLTAFPPGGSLGASSSVPINLAAPGEVDTVRVPLEVSSGRNLSVAAIPGNSTLATELVIVDASSTEVGRVSAAAGQAAGINQLPILSDGTYQILVSALAGSGDVDLQVFSGTTLELESTSGVNDTSATAQDLSADGLALDTDGVRYLVAGRQSVDQDWYRIPVTAGDEISIEAYALNPPNIQLIDPNNVVRAIDVGGVIEGFDADVTGDYFIRLTPRRFTQQDYALLVTNNASVSSQLTTEIPGTAQLPISGLGFGSLSASVDSPIRVAIHADPGDNNEDALVAQLNDDTTADFEAVSVLTTQIDTLEELQQYDVILLGAPYETLSTAAALALRQYAELGGGVVGTGYLAFAYRGFSSSNTVLQQLNAILPVDMTSPRVSTSGGITVSSTSHPITDGLTTFTFTGTSDGYAAADPDATVLATLGTTTPAISFVERTGKSAYLSPAYHWSTFPELRTGGPDQLLEQTVAWAAQGDGVDRFAFFADDGDAVNVSLTSLSGGDPIGSNDAEFQVSLYAFDSPTPDTAVATTGPSSAGSDPSDLDYVIPIDGGGRYIAEVSAQAGQGSYVVDVNGGKPLAPQSILGVESSGLPDEPVNNLSRFITVAFDRPIDLGSVQPADFQIQFEGIGGTSVAASAVQPVNAESVRFELPVGEPYYVQDGNYNITIGDVTALDQTTLPDTLFTVTIDTDPPEFISSSLDVDRNVGRNDADITVRLVADEPLRDFSIDSFPIRLQALDAQIGEPSDRGPNQVTYSEALNQVTVQFNSVPAGRHDFQLTPQFGSYVDIAGNLLDGDLDGLAGGMFQLPIIVDFDPVVPNPSAQSPIGAGVSKLAVQSVAETVGDVDTFPLELEASASVAIRITPHDPATSLSLRILDPAGTEVAVQGPRPDGVVLITQPTIDSAGIHSLEVTGSGAPGGYQLELLFNAGFESEVSDGENDTIASAESPTMAPRQLAPGASTTAISARIGQSISVSAIEDIGIPGFFDVPRAVTPWPGGTTEFLLTDGSDVFQLTAAGVASMPVGLDHFAHGIAFDGTNLLTISTQDNVLRTVDITDGSTLSTIEMTASDGGAIQRGYSLAFSPTGTLYAIVRNEETFDRALTTIDPSTGVVTFLGDFQDSFSELAFEPTTGELFAVTGDGASRSRSLFQVTETESGIATEFLFEFDTQGSGEAIAFDPVTGDLYHASSFGGGFGEEIESSDDPANLDAPNEDPPVTDWQRVVLLRQEDSVDVHRVAVTAGQWVSVAVSDGGLGLELLNSAGEVVAVGTPRGGNIAIEGFVASTNADYFARVSSQAGSSDYRLVISRDALLSLPGSTFGGPQTIPPSGIIYGRTGQSGGQGSASFDTPVSLGRTLFDAENYRWDFSSTASVNDGSSDAYDGGMRLEGFQSVSSGFSDASGRSLRFAPSTVASLTSERLVYVPSNDTFARFIDVFTNNTSTAITQTISYRTNLGSDGGTVVVATDNGDSTVSTDDRWILTDDSTNNGNDPAVAHLFGGLGGIQPDTLTRSGDNVNWSYDLTVQPGETVSLMSFAVQNFDRDSAETKTRELSNLEGNALAELPSDLIGTLLNWTIEPDESSYDFVVGTPTTVQISTATPGDADGLPLNPADPRVDLFDPRSATPDEPVASDDNSAVDGRNALLDYDVTAGETGEFGFNVLGSPGGDFVAQVSGTADGDVTGASVMLGTFAELDESLLAFPSTLRLVTDADIDLASVDASDLRVNGVPATSVQVIDGRTLEFDVASLAAGEGTYVISVSGGALSSLAGLPLEPIGQTFRVDTSSPVVVSSTIAPGDSVSPGTLTYQVTFSEPLLPETVTADQFQLTPFGGTGQVADELLYDPVASVATVTFEGLVETAYELRISSGATGVTDVLGNQLDGGPSDPLPSGDGIPGDDFVLSFVVDTSTSALPIPVEAIKPFSGRVYKASTDALIGTADDEDRFAISLAEGQAFFAAVDASAGLLAQVSVIDPSGSTVSTTAATAPGQQVTSPTLVAPSDGVFTIVVSSGLDTTGGYSVTGWLGAAPETEARDALPDNDSIANAQPLVLLPVRPTDSSLDPATRAAVVGQGGTDDYFSLPVTEGRPISLALAVDAEPGLMTPEAFQLLDPAGNVLAVSLPRPDGVTFDISEFLPEADGSVFVRVLAPDAPYALAVVSDGLFDVEPNDDGPSAQPVQVADQILGGLSLGANAFEVDFADNLGGPSLDQFVPTGLWHVTDQCDNDPSAHSLPGFAYFGIDSSCSFNAGTVSGTLTSPALGLRNGSSPALRLKYRLGSESGTTYDRAEVQVSIDGGINFTTVAT